MSALLFGRSGDLFDRNQWLPLACIMALCIVVSAL
jgi:hypothetical protein